MKDTGFNVRAGRISGILGTIRSRSIAVDQVATPVIIRLTWDLKYEIYAIPHYLVRSSFLMAYHIRLILNTHVQFNAISS